MTTARRAAFAQIQRDADAFNNRVIGSPLYRYQADWVQHALTIAASASTESMVVEMSRQSGKNEGSARLEGQLLARFASTGGEMVKTAPTWKPQIVNSKRRLDSITRSITARLPFLTFRNTQGYITECGRASIAFLSADPNASVVGATASRLMEVDEAQDVDKAKFDKDFSPMRASTGAPVMYYGTSWTTDTLLERAKLDISEGRVKGKIFRVPWDRAAEENPAYGAYVEGEIARLGKDHPLIRTQYLLLPLATRGRMLSEQQLRLMVGNHQGADRRTNEPQIVAGLDFAGADEEAGELSSLSTGSSRDSVALRIGRVDWITIAAGITEPVIRVLATYEWTNVHPTTLHTALYDILWNRWRVDRVHCDATGIGATGTAFLAQAINKPGRPERVAGQTFDSAWTTHTRLAFQYVATANGARLIDPTPSGFDPIAVSGQESAPTDDPARHIWWQRGHAKLEARPSRRVRAYVPDDEGHDDLLVADMLMVDAAYNAGMPRIMQTGPQKFYG